MGQMFLDLGNMMLVGKRSKLVSYNQLAFPIKDKDGKMLYHGAVGGKREYIQGFVNLVKQHLNWREHCSLKTHRCLWVSKKMARNMVNVVCITYC